MRLPAIEMRGNLGQPDGGFNRFDLTKERANIAELVMPPVLEEPRSFWSDLPCSELVSFATGQLLGEPD